MVAEFKQKKPLSQTVELFATGHRVRSMITLANQGKETLKVKDLEISGAALRDVAGNPLQRVPFLARIRPGQVQSCQVEFDLDPTLPPGTYEGDLSYGDVARQHFVLHVPEKVDLNLFPGTIIIRGAPGQRLTKELVMTNTGNVPVTLNKDMPNVNLSEIGELDRAIVSSLKQSAKEGYAKVLDNLVVQLADAQIRPVTITVVELDLEVKPGQTRKFTLDILLPRNTKRNRKYEGSLEIAGREIRLDVQATGDSKEVPNVVQ
jgi:hypothetical protein